MAIENQSIGPMRKVVVCIENPHAAAEELKGEQLRFEFIYGVGSEGVTPFEKAMFGHLPGDRITMEMETGRLFDTFGHLTRSVVEILPVNPSRQLVMKVDSVSAADNRELVRAMAQGAGCGSDCDCGCGC